jgi:hypothetical protein
MLVTPAFGQADNILRGQQDFFGYFSVTFDRGAPLLVFHLEEKQQPIPGLGP